MENTEKFIAQSRKTGNSLALTLPADVVLRTGIEEGDALEVFVRRISRQELKEKELLARYNYTGEGDIVYAGEKIGKVSRVYLNLHQSQDGTLENNGWKWEDREHASGYVLGAFTDERFQILKRSKIPSLMSIGLILKIKDRFGNNRSIRVKWFYHFDGKHEDINEDFFGMLLKEDEPV